MTGYIPKAIATCAICGSKEVDYGNLCYKCSNKKKNEARKAKQLRKER